MLFELKRLNRTVELEDILVEKLKEVSELRENPITAYIILHYGSTEQALLASSSEHSEVANEALIEELKISTEWPLIVDHLQRHLQEYKLASRMKLLIEE